MSDPSDGLPYDVDITVAMIDGRCECTEMIITRKRGGPPITSVGLHAIPVRRLVVDLVLKARRAGLLENGWA